MVFDDSVPTVFRLPKARTWGSIVSFESGQTAGSGDNARGSWIVVVKSKMMLRYQQQRHRADGGDGIDPASRLPPDLLNRRTVKFIIVRIQILRLDLFFGPVPKQASILMSPGSLTATRSA